MKKELALLLFICPFVFLYVFSNNLKKGKPTYSRELTLHDSFEKLEGKETENWNYIQTKRDYKDLELYDELYKKNKDLQFTSSPIFKIPKKIHVIWLGPKPFPSQSVENMRSWMAHHPDWTFKFWTDRKRPPPCKRMKVCLLEDFEFGFLKEKYEESKNWGEKTDILRYEILYREGGLYVDYNIKCHRPFHKLHTGYDFYIGLEMPHERIEDLSMTAGNSIIGARPRHPVLRGTIQKVLDRWDKMTNKFSTNDPIVQARRVTHRTLLPLTYALEGNINRPENTDIIFPAAYFFPSNGLPGFYAQHFHQGSWRDHEETQNEKYLSQTLRTLRSRDAKILRVELLCLIALIGCLTLYFLVNREIRKELK